MTKKRQRRLIAFDLNPQAGMPIEPASSNREWMDQSRDRFAYRCLPLVIANQGGWIIRCPISFSVRWNGGPELADLKVRKPRNGQGQSDYIVSHFGGGVLTILLPYLFRTPRGVNLWVKGPSNWIKDGIQPLEGIVETDWNESTFTMNWKLTRRNHSVRFEQGEPICMIVPVPRGLAESFDPVCQPLSTNPKLEKALEQWRTARTAQIERLTRYLESESKPGWQRDYLLGRKTDGTSFVEHQTKLQLRPFRRATN